MSDAVFGGLIFGGVAAAGVSLAALSAAYVVDEGRVGVKTRMGQAISQEGPSGLQFKAPFIEGIREFDVRERALLLDIAGTTSNQLNVAATFSVNWRPDPSQILSIFVDYGSPDEFASNVIAPRLRQSAKATVGTFTSVQLTTQRNEVANKVLENARAILSDYPALLSSVQLDNFQLPERYGEAVLQREEQREATEKERLALEQQRLQAQRDVQTANAAKEAAIAKADGEAYRVRVEAEADAEAIRLRGEAEADAIKLQAEALAGNPLLVELERVKAWNGTLPVTVMGDQPELLMQMPTDVVTVSKTR